MDVLLTIDTEFSAGGMWANPALGPVTDAAVWGYVDGISHGLGFVLRALADHGLGATFFTETIHTAALGPELMRPAVAAMRAAGQDVQVHAHPMWLALVDGRADRRAPNDQCARCDAATVARLMQISHRAFADWGLPPAVAFRSGNLSAGSALSAGLAQAGIAVTSNIGVAYNPAVEVALHRQNGRLQVGGLPEVPVTSFRSLDPRGPRLRPLTIAACGHAEMVAIIEAAERAGLPEVVILTHPFEFVQAADYRLSRLQPNRLTQDRLLRLCAWLAARRERFSTPHFAERVASWQAQPTWPEAQLRAPLWPALRRIVENVLNDLRAPR